MLRNVRTTRIEWCDCDPAGIIFYPRYFEIFDTSTTALIERVLGMNKFAYLKAYDFAGHPVVETRARFRQPTRFGDDISIETKLIECGEFDPQARAPDQQRRRPCGRGLRDADLGETRCRRSGAYPKAADPRRSGRAS